MSKLILSILILSSFLFVSSSSAQTTTPDFQAVIKQLQDQIKLLNQQIAELQSSLKETQKEVEIVKTELKLTKSLKKGESNDEVKQLQEFLKQFPDIYPEGIVTGFFGSLTETAVKRFQQKHGIESIGIVGPKTIQKLNEFSVSGIPAIPAIPAVPGVLPAVPAIPASLSLPFQPASASQPIAAIPATPAIPAIPGVSTAIPAVPATPAQPSSSTSTPTPTPSVSISPSPTVSVSYSFTPTPTPTPISSTSPLVVQPGGGLANNIYIGSTLSANVAVNNLTCRWEVCDSPPTTLKVYYTPWYDTSLTGVAYEAGPHYGEQTFSVPSIPAWGSFTVRWQGGVAGSSGRYWFVTFVDPDNLLGMESRYRGPHRGEFYITNLSSPLIFTEGPSIGVPSIDDLTWLQPEAVTIKWKTSEPCQTMVYYGLTSGYGLTVNPGRVDSGNSYMSNLQQNTNYHYKVACTTSGGKTLDSGDRTFMTGSASVSTPTPTPAQTASVSFSPLDSPQILALANMLEAVKSIIEKLNNLLPLIKR